MLFLVSTPIGNLQDISLRAIETLKSVSMILCEDTRTSKTFLKKHGISTFLSSFHQFNEKKEEEKILSLLLKGEDIAMISDAGTPCISDPGHLLVKRCLENGVVVRAIPGACSVTTALILSGFAPLPFSFFGFLPKKEGEKKRALKKALSFEGTSLFFESAKRVKKTLGTLEELGYEKKVFLAREMTKKFEQHLLGSVKEVMDRFTEELGEIVLVLEGGGLKMEAYDSIEIIDLLQKEHDLPLKEAIKMAAKILKEDRKSLYKKSVDR